MILLQLDVNRDLQAMVASQTMLTLSWHEKPQMLASALMPASITPARAPAHVSEAIMISFTSERRNKAYVTNQ